METELSDVYEYPDVLFAHPSPNSLATCRTCNERIKKGEIRIVWFQETSWGASPRYAHAACSHNLITGTIGHLERRIRVLMEALVLAPSSSRKENS